jgi:hypothetical protein
LRYLPRKKIETVDIGDSAAGAPDIIADAFSDDFIAENSATYDALVLPDCGGPWYDIQNSNNKINAWKQLRALLDRLSEMLKPGGKIFFSKIFDKKTIQNDKDVTYDRINDYYSIGGPSNKGLEHLVGNVTFMDEEYECKEDDDMTTIEQGSRVTLQTVADDGSCFFDSVARILTGGGTRKLGPLIHRLRMIGMGDEADQYTSIVHSILLERQNTRRFRGYEILVARLDKRHKESSGSEVTMEEITEYVRDEHKKWLQQKVGSKRTKDDELIDDFFAYCDDQLEVDEHRYADDNDYSKVVNNEYIRQRFMILVVNVDKVSDIPRGEFQPLCLERDEISRIVRNLCNNSRRRLAILARTGGGSKAKKSMGVHYQPVLFNIPGSDAENSKPIARIYDDELLRNFIVAYMHKCSRGQK